MCQIAASMCLSLRPQDKAICMLITVQQDATIYSFLYFCKLLYMFRVIPSPIIRSRLNCNYSIWHWSNRIATVR